MHQILLILLILLKRTMLTRYQSQFQYIFVSKNCKKLKNRLQQTKNPSTLTVAKLNQMNIHKIPQCFRCLTSLIKLNLWGNQIRKIQNLETLTSLKQLDLDDNKIIKIQNLDTLIFLRQLSLFNNQIKKIQNLEKLTSIQQLYLGNSQQIHQNRIQKIQMIPNTASNNFCRFQSLKVLSLYHTQIVTIEGILHIKIPNLTKIFLHYNKICNFCALRRAYIPQIQYLQINNNKTEQIGLFSEITSKNLRFFSFGKYLNFGLKEKLNQRSSSALIFKIESLQLQQQKSNIWKQRQKRSKFNLRLL